MRRPHMSTGAWIFASVIAASVIAPTAVYAAATSTVAIGNTANSTTAAVTAKHQLLTTTVSPGDVVHSATASGGCSSLYVPPAGKAIVVTSVTYEVYGNTPGADAWAYLVDLSGSQCAGFYDAFATSEADASASHTFPIGLPMSSVALKSGGGYGVLAGITGYLIPAGQLSAAAAAANPPARLPHPTH